jgi:dipeptidyl-peptidase-4
MKIKISLLLLLLALTPYLPADAQAIKSILTPYGWKDDNTLLLSKRQGGKMYFYEYDIKSGDTLAFTFPDSGDQKLIQKFRKEGEKNHSLSPDKKWIAFTRGNDLYTLDTETGKEIRHTFNGSDLILNGYASWVYYEEIFGRASNYKAFWWSPDSRHLVFYTFDQSQVPAFPIFNYSGKHGTLKETRYPKAGDPNPRVEINIVQADGSRTLKVKTDSEKDQYFGMPLWSSNGDRVIIQWMNRGQDTFKLYSADINSGDVKEIYNEHQNTWIEWIEEVIQGKEGLYIVRDKDMWEQIYYVDYTGKTPVKLTGERQWGTKLLTLDEKAGRLFFISRKETSVRNDLYCVTWKTKFLDLSVSRLSVGKYNYSSVMISPEGDRFVSVISNIYEPPKLAVAAIDWKNRTGKDLRILDDSKGDKTEFSKIPSSDIIFITTPDGYRLPASVMWPVNMDRSKKYPVLFYIYGGPNSSVVMDTWKTPSEIVQRLAEEGVIQVSVDNRASGHCGKEGMNFVHRRLGKYELEDYILWAKYLKAFPFVDGSRIGITGYSYGGTMTLLALTEGAEYFRFGIAGGGVYDWQLYDSHYTERYMDSPEENPDGYFWSAVINKASLYRDKEGSLLMITHGTDDDNVHLQNTMQLTDALQKSLKHFEMMLYPGGLHGYRGYQGQHSVDEDFRFWRKTLLYK